MRKLAVIFLFISLFSFSAFGKEMPIVIESQKLVYDDAKKVAVYLGSVIAQRGETIIKGDKLTLFFSKDGKQVKKVVVEGNVYIKDSRGEGWCDKLIYYPAQEKAVLIGHAKLKQKKNLIVGDQIIAWKDGRVEVIGKTGRVKTVFYPEEKDGKPQRP